MTMTEDWTTALAVLPHADRVLLWGPPATGKTRAALTVGLGEGAALFALTLTEETPAAEVRGHYLPTTGGGFAWHDGPGVAARFRASPDGPRARLVLNELDHASGDVQSLLLALCDDDASARLTLPTGETLVASAATSIVATMNGDPASLPEALRSRFAVCVRIDATHPEALAALPADLRQAAERACLLPEDRRLDVRTWNAYAGLRERIHPEAAAHATFGPAWRELFATMELSIRA